jgi:hypothetical protein
MKVQANLSLPIDHRIFCRGRGFIEKVILDSYLPAIDGRPQERDRGRDTIEPGRSTAPPGLGVYLGSVSSRIK